eukprot:358056-Chlamydomonas_euryale.AAC.3
MHGMPSPPLMRATVPRAARTHTKQSDAASRAPMRCAAQSMRGGMGRAAQRPAGCRSIVDVAGAAVAQAPRRCSSSSSSRGGACAPQPLPRAAPNVAAAIPDGGSKATECVALREWSVVNAAVRDGLQTVRQAGGPFPGAGMQLCVGQGIGCVRIGCTSHGLCVCVWYYNSGRLSLR